MNDERKWELEQFFDGELPDAERRRVERELSGDMEAAHYVAQLGQLRSLAARHDPGAAIPMTPPASPVWLRPVTRRRWAAAVAVASAAAAVIIASVSSWWQRGEPSHKQTPRTRAVVSKEPRGIAPAEESAPASAPGPRLDIDAQRYVWANGQMPSPADAARLVLGRNSRPTQPTPAEFEILAIELANASSVSREELGRAVSERPSWPRHQPNRSRAVRRPAETSPRTQREQTEHNLVVEIGNPTDRRWVG